MSLSNFVNAKVKAGIYMPLSHLISSFSTLIFTVSMRQGFLFFPVFLVNSISQFNLLAGNFFILGKKFSSQYFAHHMLSLGSRAEIFLAK